jgi:hypothetical protein
MGAPPQSFGGQLTLLGIAGTEIDLAANLTKDAAEIVSDAFAPARYHRHPVAEFTYIHHDDSSPVSRPPLPAVLCVLALRNRMVGYH